VNRWEKLRREIGKMVTKYVKVQHKGRCNNVYTFSNPASIDFKIGDSAVVKLRTGWLSEVKVVGRTNENPNRDYICDVVHKLD
jgi:hypothetical protein